MVRHSTDGVEEQVDFLDFYAEYHGHAVAHLRRVLPTLRQGRRAAIFLAGDSSLDNKYWFDAHAPALNGYERALSPPEQKLDVAYWLNNELVRRGRTDLFALNAAVEATTLDDRARGALLPQDAFVREHLTRADHVVVSIGGNDIALAPTLCTVINALPLVRCAPALALRRAACACPPDPYGWCGDLGCQGAQGCAAGVCCGCPPGLGYMVDLFGHRVRQYVLRLLGARRPATVVICMIYFPDAGRASGGWADAALGALGYDAAPHRLQLLIRAVFELATRRIRIEGTRVVPFAMFDVLDGRDPRDYVQRVEPSPVGLSLIHI